MYKKFRPKNSVEKKEKFSRSLKLESLIIMLKVNAIKFDFNFKFGLPLNQFEFGSSDSLEMMI